MDLLADSLGNAGVICFLVAYFLLQKGRFSPTGLPYLLLNLAGASLLMISLAVHWNLAAFMLEAAWAVISIFGIYRNFINKK